MRLRSAVGAVSGTLAVALALGACSSTASDQLIEAPPGLVGDVLDGSPSPSPSPTPSPSPSPTPSPSPSPTAVVGAFDGERAHALAVELTIDIGVRDAGSEGDLRARSWWARHLQEAGWTTVAEDFPLPQGGTTANVVAWLGPDDPREGPHVVVGGHLDTVAGSPGANDNATGVAALVVVAEELADELRLEPPELPLVLVAFGAEEFQPSEPREHHLGSELYAGAHREQVVAMLSVDMIGIGPRTCICWLRDTTSSLGEQLRALSREIGHGESFALLPRGDISDHGPFARRGIPAAFLWTFVSEGYHSPADTPEKLQVEPLQRAGDLLLAWLRGDALTVDGGS